MAFAIEIEIMGRRRWIERHIPLTQRAVLGQVPIEAVITVQADGHELSEVLNTFTNVPWSTTPVNKWRGDWARFIVENLPY